MTDPIERQAAINEIARWKGYIDEDMILRIQTGLKKVPSAQPDVPDRNVGDLISRQAAIDALEEQLDYLQMLNKDENPKAESVWYGVSWARNTIAELPSAQPEIVRCRECKRWNTVIDRNKAEYGLCQNRSQLEATKADFYCADGERRCEDE